MKSIFAASLFSLAFISLSAAPDAQAPQLPTIEITMVNWSGKSIDAKAQMKCVKGPAKTKLDSSPRFSSNQIVMQWFIDPSPECRNSARALAVDIAGTESRWAAPAGTNPPAWVYTVEGKSAHPSLRFLKYFIRRLTATDHLDLQLDL